MIWEALNVTPSIVRAARVAIGSEDGPSVEVWACDGGKVYVRVTDAHDDGRETFLVPRAVWREAMAQAMRETEE